MNVWRIYFGSFLIGLGWMIGLGGPVLAASNPTSTADVRAVLAADPFMSPQAISARQPGTVIHPPRKVTICHNGQSLDVAETAVPAHLAHGDTLGPCAGGGSTKGNNGVGNGVDPQPPGNPPVNDGLGTGPGKPGNKR